MDPLIAIGEDAPQFQLKDLRGEIYSLEEMRGRIVVMNFWSAECGWCERVDHELMKYLDAWKERVIVLWIASNANESSELITRVATERNLPTVLLDEHQLVANLYGVETTPQFIVVDSKGKLAYMGSWDNVTFKQRAVTQVYVSQVVVALIQDRVPQFSHTPPYGCVLVRHFE